MEAALPSLFILFLAGVDQTRGVVVAEANDKHKRRHGQVGEGFVETGEIPGVLEEPRGGKEKDREACVPVELLPGEQRNAEEREGDRAEGRARRRCLRSSRRR